MQGVLLCAGLLAVAVALAVISGINDGGVLLAPAVRYPVVPVGWFVAVLCLALVSGPLLLGVSVARTLESGIFGGQDDTRSVFLIGVAVALVVVLGLSRGGLPTSLTLALVGGLSGAAWGSGLGVAGGTVGKVLLIGAAAPTVGMLAGWLVGQLSRMRPAERRRTGTFRALHVTAFSLQCLAYAINDGQKMLAVAAVAVAALPGAVAVLDSGNPGMLAAVSGTLMLLFCLGMLSSVRAVSGRIASGLAVLRPVDAISAQFVAAASVLASSAAGAPVSMTQALAGGVVGAAGSKGMRRVRWDAAARIAGAWLVTLPASGTGAFAVAALVRYAGGAPG
jgi:PiT family inorganic phosphate transporter